MAKTFSKKICRGVDIFVVELTDINSNTFDAIIRFKKSIPSEVANASSANNLSPITRKVNEYGETVAAGVRQQQKRFADEEVPLLVSGYKTGKSVYQLADEFGCNRQTVSAVLKRNGVNVTICKYDKLDADDVIAMYGAMHTTQQIADKYEVSPRVILKCLRKHGVKIRGRWDY